MKVSIAVPSMNYGRYIWHCLGSLAEQDHADLEVLIADGGSSDDSLDIIHGFCQRDRRFQLVSTRDDGQADAVNRAHALASGDVLGFLNADDFLLCKDALSSVVEAFRMHSEADVVSFAGFYADEDGRLIKPVRLRYHPLDRLALMKYRSSVLQPATFWTRKVAQAVSFRPEFHYVFDAVFFYEAYRRFTWLELPKAIAGYRLHGANKSTMVRSSRISELARYEELKFGHGSLRAAYLRFVGASVMLCERLPFLGRPLRVAIYLVVNSLAFASAYRIPGI